MPGEREREGKPPVESPGGAVPRSLDRGCSAAAPGGCWAGGGDGTGLLGAGLGVVMGQASWVLGWRW